MKRQPEIGSALGLSSDGIMARAAIRQHKLTTLRVDLVAALGFSIDHLNEGEPPLDVTLQLRRTIEGIMTEWLS